MGLVPGALATARLVSCGARRPAIAAIHDHRGRSITLPWISVRHNEGDALIVDLSGGTPLRHRPSAAAMPACFPRLRGAASIDGAHGPRWSPETGGRTCRGVARARSAATIARGQPARFLSLQLEGDLRTPDGQWQRFVNGSLAE
jgi:hypothetical protein